MSSFDLKKFLEEGVPYKEYPCDIYELNRAMQLHIVIDHYCETCGMIRSYRLGDSENQKMISSYLMRSGVNSGEKFDCFLTLPLYCQHGCGEKHAVAVYVTPTSIMKIGQYPSFSKLEVISTIEKYKNILSKYYVELTRSISAYSQGMGIAAFVYLRRILEHLVETKYSQIYEVPEHSKFVDKLSVVDKEFSILPEELADCKNALYSILSKGVHEYSEDECIEIYPIMKFTIETILDIELAQKIREKKLGEVKKTLKQKFSDDKKD